MWKKYLVPALAALAVLSCLPAAADWRLDSQLLAAADKGDAGEIRRLLDRGASLEARSGDDGRTPLIAAAASGNAEAITLLLDRGANLEAVGLYVPCNTPLTAAVAAGKDGAMRLLVQKGAKLEGRTCDKDTPLSIAARADNESAMNFFLDRGADIEARNNRGFTPLIAAVAAGKIEAVKLLLARGANVNAAAKNGYMFEGDEGMTPLIAATAAGRPEIAALLLDKGADVRAKTKTGYTAFNFALANSSSEAMAPLFRKIAAAYGHDDYADALVATARSFKPESVAALLTMTGGVLKKEDLNKALLATAASATWGNCSVDTRCEDTVKVLLDHGADVDARDGQGNTPFILAVLSDEWSVEAVLRERGADLNARNNAGNTAIVEAAIRNAKKPNLVKLYGAEEVRYAINMAALYGSQQALEGLLEESGAPPAAFEWKSDNEYGDAATGFRPDLGWLAGLKDRKPDLTRIAVYAAGHGDCALAERLTKENASVNPNALVDGTAMQRGFDTTNLLSAAARHCPADFVRLLIGRGGDVSLDSGPSIAGPASDRVLQAAALSGNVATAKLLFEKGARIDASHAGVLIQAACSGNPEMLELMIGTGSGLWNRQNYDYAFVQSINGGCTAALPVLLQHGASVDDFFDLRGDYALWDAAGAGSAEVIKLLLERHRDAFTPQDVQDAILKACGSGKPEALDAFLAAGFKIRTPRAALEAAVESGSVAMTKRLIELGADMEFGDADNMRALFFAAARGNTEVVRYLLDRGARIDAASSVNETALIAAARSGYKDAKHLEDRYAATVALLLERGAQVNVKSNDGEELLIPDQATFRQVMGRLAHMKAKPDHVYYDGVRGWTALSWAAYTCNTPAVKMLLDKGADINAADAEGNTPLILAAFHCDADTVQVLVDRGANLKARNHKGYTALAIARQYDVDNERRARRKAPVIALLEKAGKGK